MSSISISEIDVHTGHLIILRIFYKVFLFLLIHYFGVLLHIRFVNAIERVISW